MNHQNRAFEKILREAARYRTLLSIYGKDGKLNGDNPGAIFQDGD